MDSSPKKLCRVLCIGLGGGTLPLFLAHHFPGMDIHVVELDPVVIAAAQQAMGFPKDRSALSGVCISILSPKGTYQSRPEKNHAQFLTEGVINNILKDTLRTSAGNPKGDLQGQATPSQRRCNQVASHLS